MMDFPTIQNSRLLKRKSDNSFRELYLQNDFIDFSSNDYLGFSRNKFIFNAVRNNLERFVHLNGSTGSRLLSGNYTLHEEVETQLADFFHAESSLLFNSGYDANIGLLSSIPQHGDIILFDELCHASIRDGIRLSHAKSFSFKHNDLQDLEKKYFNTNNMSGSVFVVIESIYSMDGDMAPLKSIAEFCQKFKCYFIVDEAHSTGVFEKSGRGLVVDFDLEKTAFARVHTFGKALGCHGAVVVGSNELKDYLINYARSFIYTTAMPLHNVLTIKYAFIELLKTEELLRLRNNISIFKKEIKSNNLDEIFISSDSAIQSCIIGNITKVKEIAHNFRRENFDVKAILSPTVPVGTERLRFCIHSYNSTVQIKEVLKLFSNFTQNLEC